MKLRIGFLWIMSLCFVGAAPAFASYQDEIGAGVEEVWQSAREILKPYGIQKEVYKKKVLETKWIEDRIERSRGILKKVASEMYLRQYKIKVELTPLPDRTGIKVSGSFREKPLEAPPAVSWRPIKPGLQDYDLERDFFFHILEKVQQLRTQSP